MNYHHNILQIFHWIYNLLICFIASAISCHIGDLSENTTTAECKGTNYCWKYEQCGNKCKTGRGCGGEHSESGNYEIFMSYFGTLKDTCLTKNVRIGEAVKLTGCACSTDLCNAGSIFKLSYAISIFPCILFVRFLIF